MPHLFISYSKKDTRDLALNLADALNALDGLTAWVDRSLRAGRSWELQIQSEIDRCDTMIVLYSPDINRHKQGEPESYVLNEIFYAKYHANKPIIPVMARQTDPPMSLIQAHYIDFTLNGLTVTDLVDAVCAELEIAPAQAVSPSDPLRHVFEMMPPPFDLVTIPAGQVTIEDSVIIVPEFQIAKYPVTNAQYARFIEARGYHEQGWWTVQGWEYRQSEKWTQPRYWTNGKWNVADYPVVGVSWFEAVAFCNWLNGQINSTSSPSPTGTHSSPQHQGGEQKQIMLPTEAQWQRAAQGDDGRNYPWGDEWDCQKCNNRVNPCVSDGTTPVNRFAGAGDSPFGVVDLAGNVWEWCLTDSEQQTDDVHSNAEFRVLHGGSWFDVETESFRSSLRNGGAPLKWSRDWGFRFACS